MRVVYAGTPDFAVAPLIGIVEAGYEVVGVITQPDRPQGRKGILTPSPVKAYALTKGLPILQPEKLKSELDSVKELGGDVLITCAYGQILTQELLDSFPLGVYNIHASLLPKYRGASPIQWAVLNGEKETGITVMKTDIGLDTGDILLAKSLLVGSDTAGELAERLSILGTECILEALPLIESGAVTLKKQEGEASVVRKIVRESAHIDWNKSAEEIVRLIHGMNPSPIAYAETEGAVLNCFKAEVGSIEGEGENGSVLTDLPKQGLHIKCEGGSVKLLEVQLSGGKRMKASDLLNGRKLKKGQLLV